MNYVHLQIAKARCPVTTHKAVQFFQADRLGFGISIPACLIVRQVIPLDGTSRVAPLKSSKRKDFYTVPSTGHNASLMCGVGR